MIRIMIESASAFFAILLFAAFLEIPRRHLPFAALCGGIGWPTYALIVAADKTAMAAAFFSTLAVALLSQVLARIRKAPVTVFLVAGILPVVPGAAIYRSVYYLMRSNPVSSTYYLLETLRIAGAIAMAIFITDSLFRLSLAYRARQNPKP